MGGGFAAEDVNLVGPKPHKQNLVVRRRGRDSGSPILFLAHLDVVEARREDWSMDPFTLTERDGYFYGRGTMDIKVQATIQCRLLPDDSSEQVRRALTRLVADTTIRVTLPEPPDTSPASPPSPEVMSAVERVTTALWPGVIVLPVMDPWTTDGRYFRAAGTPVYGVSGIFYDVSDVRAHGKDERILVRSFYEGVEFTYRLIKDLGGV